eukprot:3454100-Alexandrium_andersonii.AAC.1
MATGHDMVGNVGEVPEFKDMAQLMATAQGSGAKLSDHASAFGTAAVGNTKAMLDDSESEEEKDDDADASEKASEKGKSSN